MAARTPVEISRDRIQELADREERRLDDRTPGSSTMYERARQTLSGGVSSSYQVRDPWPIYLSHGKGAKVWDVDGNGNLTTDAMRLRYGTQLAFTNGGGLRSPLPAPGYLPQDTALRRTNPGYAAGPPFDLVIGDVFTLLPFGNSVVTRMVTGSQLWSVLEHSVGAMPAANGRFGQISGFKFTYDVAAAPGLRVQSVALDDGTPILKDNTLYSFATNDFTNTGGDGYTMLADGQGVTREVMADVVLDYIRTKALITPTIEGRITRLN